MHVRNDFALKFVPESKIHIVKLQEVARSTVAHSPEIIVYVP